MATGCCVGQHKGSGSGGRAGWLRRADAERRAAALHLRSPVFPNKLLLRQVGAEGNAGLERDPALWVGAMKVPKHVDFADFCPSRLHPFLSVPPQP